VSPHETSRVPRVLLDATAIPADRGGVGRYLEGLVSAYADDLVIVCQQRDLQHFSMIAPRARLVGAPALIRRAPLRLLWEQFALPGIARRTGAAVIHSPHYTTTLMTRMPRIVTFHDATFFSDPDLHGWVKRVFFRTWVRLSSRMAGIIVPSAATESELRRYVRIPAPVTVAPHGVDRTVFHPPTPDAVAAFADRLGLVGGWIAFLGTLEPRKNVPALIAALDAVARRRSDRGGTTPQLVLAGAPGWDQKIDTAIARADGITVKRAGYLPLPELPALLGGAVFVAYPSLGEGFGLPVLEAMAVGAAVLTTPRLAIPEVGGDTVAYSEPDPDSLATAIESLLDDPERRARLGADARSRAESFTWERCAALHVLAYAAAVTR
jgi:glycosyltransferase involved in cell wall biosynthesis